MRHAMHGAYPTTHRFNEQKATSRQGAASCLRAHGARPAGAHPFTEERTNMRTTIALTGAALIVGLAGPAHAATVRLTDPQDVAHGVDLRAVKVKHTDTDVVVVTRHTDLQRDPKSGAGGTVYLDTDRGDKGPEYVFVGGYFEGTDYQLLHTEGFGVEKWGDAVEGSYELRINYDEERVRMRMSRAALGNPADVRVAVKVGGSQGDGKPAVVDWLGEPRSYTPWVAKG